MKVLDCLMAGAVICCIHSGSAQAQCTGGLTPTLITYDTTVTGTGADNYVFEFPKFDPALGTLYSIRVQAVISINYTFGLENQKVTSEKVRHKYYRSDEITGTALIDPIIGDYQTPAWYGYYTVAGSDGISGSGPDYIEIGPLVLRSADTLINETLSNTGDFMGVGNVQFNYQTSSDNVLSAFTDIFPSINDVLKFNVSYAYCSALILTPNSIQLTTQAVNPLSALIKWKTSNESKAKSYEVMVSEDGVNFTTAAILPASGVSVNDIGNYQYKYDLTSPARKLFFRIKQVTKDNRASVSAIKPVNWLTKANEIVFIPDPSGTSLSVQLPSSGATSWQVALFGINGQIIQTNYITASTSASLPIKQKLSKGIYVVRARNSVTNELITQKLFIQ